jgi:hypothetical protein
MRRSLFTVALAAAACAATLVSVPSASATTSPWFEQRWWCDANDPLPPDHMTEQQAADEAQFYPEAKGQLSRRDCRRLSYGLVAARRYAMQYPTAADAYAAGFRMIVPFVDGMGAHYIGPDGITATADPRRPNFLLYGGNESDSPLVGLMWLVASGQAPPADGLPGGNDHWHRHMRLCLVRGLVVGEDLTNAQCRALGGFNLDTSNLWMLHAWVVPQWKYRPDVFRPHHPHVGHGHGHHEH